MSEERSMLFDDWAGTRHRSLQIEKQENGYIVKATFSVQKTEIESYTMIDSPKKKVWRKETRTFVFYTDTEVLTFTKGYLKAAVTPASPLSA